MGKEEGIFFFSLKIAEAPGVSYLSLHLIEGPHRLFLKHINLTEVCEGNVYFHPKSPLRVYY